MMFHFLFLQVLNKNISLLKTPSRVCETFQSCCSPSHLISCRPAGVGEEAFQAAASSQQRQEEETADCRSRGRPGSHHRPSPEEEEVSDQLKLSI